MLGREFLELARELLALGTLPRHWRAVIIHAYYGLFHECLAAMTRWGLPPPARHSVHFQVRNRLIYATDSVLRDIGQKLETLVKDRNAASYDLRGLTMFATSFVARDSVQMATDALALLDGIDADPARRAVAVASIRP